METIEQLKAEIQRLMNDVDIALNLQEAAQRSEAEMKKQLNKALGQLAEVPKWISVTERLPEKYTEVLLYPPPGDYVNSGERDDKGFYYSEYVHQFGVEVWRAERVTHWYPIPAAPTQKESNHAG